MTKWRPRKAYVRTRLSAALPTAWFQRRLEPLPPPLLLLRQRGQETTLTWQQPFSLLLLRSVRPALLPQPWRRAADISSTPAAHTQGEGQLRASAASVWPLQRPTSGGRLLTKTRAARPPCVKTRQDVPQLPLRLLWPQPLPLPLLPRRPRAQPSGRRRLAQQCLDWQQCTCMCAHHPFVSQWITHTQQIDRQSR